MTDPAVSACAELLERGTLLYNLRSSDSSRPRAELLERRARNSRTRRWVFQLGAHFLPYSLWVASELFFVFRDAPLVPPMKQRLGWFHFAFKLANPRDATPKLAGRAFEAKSKVSRGNCGFLLQTPLWFPLRLNHSNGITTAVLLPLWPYGLMLTPDSEPHPTWPPLKSGLNPSTKTQLNVTQRSHVLARALQTKRDMVGWLPFGAWLGSAARLPTSHPKFLGVLSSSRGVRIRAPTSSGLV